MHRKLSEPSLAQREHTHQGYPGASVPRHTAHDIPISSGSFFYPQNRFTWKWNRAEGCHQVEPGGGQEGREELFFLLLAGRLTFLSWGEVLRDPVPCPFFLSVEPTKLSPYRKD